MHYLSSSGLECKVGKVEIGGEKLFAILSVFRLQFVTIFALTYDSFCDVIFASIVRLFLTLHSSPDVDR